MNTGDWERDFDFVKDVGRKTLEAITTIVNQHKELSWTAEEKDEQLLKEDDMWSLIYCGIEEPFLVLKQGDLQRPY